MLLQKLEKEKLIKPPSWLPENTVFLGTMGSIAYGVAEDTSDFDVYGIAVPPRNQIFLHLTGYIDGFGKKPEQFQSWQKHHVLDKSALNGKGREYDFTIFGIVKYFQLCMDGNPNIIDFTFIPQSCVLHITNIGNMIRDNRHMFLGKHMWPKFKGYSFSTMAKLSNKNHKRLETLKKFEQEHELSHKTTFNEVEAEMKKRNFI